MPSSDLLKRLEALNGGPLRESVEFEHSCDDQPLPEDPAKAVVKSARPRTLAGKLPKGEAVCLQEAVPGEERATAGGGRYYHVERLLTDHLDWCDDLAVDICTALPGIRSGRSRRSHALPRPEEVVFLDVETLGLSSDSPIFLVGKMVLTTDGRIYCRQLLAREPAEEQAAIAAAAEGLANKRLLVTFNGRGYDMPLLESRAAHFGVRLPCPPAHVDMLLEARRRYSRKLPNCRLQTLEERVCGRSRSDDVPSNRIPGVYRQFLKTGNAALLSRVIHHNLLDLATTAELFTLFFG